MGTSFYSCRKVPQERDHPHACGDKLAESIGVTGEEGSSPRVWGQEQKSYNNQISARIIPTRVGTSARSCRAYIRVQDHPHACGDKVKTQRTRLAVAGSSPRVWGQDIIFELLTIDFRDHPHACGDKYQSRCYQDFIRGSSPRVWGQVKRSRSPFNVAWIIPTRVGTSPVSRWRKSCREDHPHACGDKHHSSALPPFRIGSSPRVWGQVYDCSRDCAINRIIPTRVGTRRTIFQAKRNTRDHPHACGDKIIRRFKHSLYAGSSPRVWGQERQRIPTHAQTRIIPTRVGTSYLSVCHT